MAFTATTTEAVLAPTTLMQLNIKHKLLNIEHKLSRFKLDVGPMLLSEKSRGFNVMFIIAGITLVPLGIILTIAWIILCFGSVIVGILILFTLPIILIAPLTISFLGMNMIHEGVQNLNS